MMSALIEKHIETRFFQLARSLIRRGLGHHSELDEKFTHYYRGEETTLVIDQFYHYPRRYH